MSEKSRAEFILEVIKLLLWPTLIVIAVMWLQDDVMDLLKSRTWKIGIIEVGNKIENLENTVQGELILQKDYLIKILNNSSDSTKVREYVHLAMGSIENAQSGVKKDIQSIQETIPERRESQLVSQQTMEEKPKTAKRWEYLGFNNLVEKEIDNAIEAFTESEKLWPNYHNVSEIRLLLVEKREILKAKDSPEWRALYNEILEKYSWGMPSDIRQKLL